MPGEPWLILPTYNEAENIEAIVSAAGEVLARAAPEGYRVLIVDDGSPDGTGAIADRLAAELGWVQVLHRAEKNGIGPAYMDKVARRGVKTLARKGYTAVAE